MVNFIDNCGFLSDYQFGFRKGKSTTDAIFEVTLFESNGLRNKNFVSYAFLDLKDFESVSHEILLSKLYRTVFRGHINLFLKDYLNKRHQAVFMTTTQTLKPLNVCSLGINSGSHIVLITYYGHHEIKI